MRDDLEGLEISHKELQELTNLPVNDNLTIITNPLQKFGRRLIEKIKGTEGATVVFLGFSLSVFTYLLFHLGVQLLPFQINHVLLLIFLVLWLGGVSQSVLYFIWMRKGKLLKANMTNSLRILLNDVARYNAVIKAIDINDQIEAAGNPEVNIQQRDKIIAALKLTRADLIRALKTEKILISSKSVG